LRVFDDGIGFDKRTSHRDITAITGMRERAEAMGGTCKLQPIRGGEPVDGSGAGTMIDRDVDDYPVVREGLTAALHGRDDIEVIGSFDVPREAIHEAERLRRMLSCSTRTAGPRRHRRHHAFRGAGADPTAYGPRRMCDGAFDAGRRAIC